MTGTIKRAPVCHACTPEQLRQLNSNVATILAFRYLWPADEQDRHDAFDGLVALCWKARGNLAIYAQPWERLPSIARMDQLLLGRTPWACTRDFIEDFVLKYFEPYEGKSEEQILSAALQNKFRYIGHRLKGRMTDEIRKRTALKNQEPLPERLDVLLENDAESVSITPDYQGEDGYSSTLSDATKPRHTNSSTPLDFIKAREPSLTDALGRSYEVLAAAVEVFPRAYEGTDQAGKSALTRAIARRRRVSEQQARDDKRQFHEKVFEEMLRGNPDLNDLHALLARGDDEHTLREDFISGDGRRKRSIRLRIELPNKQLSFSNSSPDKD